MEIAFGLLPKETGIGPISHFLTFPITRLRKLSIPGPGNWRSAKGTISLRNCHFVQNRHNENFLQGKIRRQFTFNEATGRSIQGLQYPVSWTTVDSLTLEDGTPSQGINLWRILQVPVGGQVYVASSNTGCYRLHFGDKAGFVKAGVGRLEAEITGDLMYKIGMSQQGVKNLIAYARTLSDDSMLVIARWFEVPANAVYLDTPMDEPGTAGDVIQIYNDNGFFGGFGELEIHSSGLQFPSDAAKGDMPKVSDSLLTLVGTMSPSDWEAWKACNSGS